MRERIEVAGKEMDASEDALIDAGFSEEHWMRIKHYIFSAVLLNDLKKQHDVDEVVAHSKLMA